jgi:hypothetical protein
LREEFPAATLNRDPSLEAMVDAALRAVVGQTGSIRKVGRTAGA